MPLNHNPWALELLLWHGHDRGGVRVPFDESQGNPLRDSQGSSRVIVTPLIERVRRAAEEIASGIECPRFIFLVGGPGNGKSEAVQEFIKSLDASLGCSGLLVDLVRRRFTPNPVLPWKVEIAGADSTAVGGDFANRVGRLVVIQDASASELPNSDAAESLVTEFYDLVTHPDPLPVFVCCVNRGLLARALRAAHADQIGPAVEGVLDALVRSTALGKEMLSEHRVTSWPLALPGHDRNGAIACWPMDLESLLLSPEDGGRSPSAIHQLLDDAVTEERWEIEERCRDCESRSLCPLRQNAQWLRNEQEQRALLTILRRGELATARRWSFRDAFSLAAEIVVGERQDFDPHPHPCDWVHEHAQSLLMQSTVDPQTVKNASVLVERLYPQALLPEREELRLPEEVHNAAEIGMDLTLAVADSLGSRVGKAATHIRGLLRDALGPRIDPALLSPQDGTHPLAELENAFSQSVSLGFGRWPAEAMPSAVEAILINAISNAELEWDRLGRDSAIAMSALRYLRAVAARIAKRSVGVRLGFHAQERELIDYALLLRDAQKLNQLRQGVRELLGGINFQFNELESYGQPQTERDWLVVLKGGSMNIRPIQPAPRSSDQLPGHDIPYIQISGEPIALSFDLYLAIRLRREGCVSSSLPTAVRAAIDRIRHLQAGETCRNRRRFVEEGLSFTIGKTASLGLDHESAQPVLRGI